MNKFFDVVICPNVAPLSHLQSVSLLMCGQNELEAVSQAVEHCELYLNLNMDGATASVVFVAAAHPDATNPNARY